MDTPDAGRFIAGVSGVVHALPRIVSLEADGGDGVNGVPELELTPVHHKWFAEEDWAEVEQPPHHCLR